jgi:hypothetical protein
MSRGWVFRPRESVAGIPLPFAPTGERPVRFRLSGPEEPGNALPEAAREFGRKARVHGRRNPLPDSARTPLMPTEMM